MLFQSHIYLKRFPTRALCSYWGMSETAAAASACTGESCAPWYTDWLQDNVCEGFNLKRYKSDY
jgi:hypothetical protein